MNVLTHSFMFYSKQFLSYKSSLMGHPFWPTRIRGISRKRCVAEQQRTTKKNYYQIEILKKNNMDHFHSTLLINTNDLYWFIQCTLYQLRMAPNFETFKYLQCRKFIAFYSENAMHWMQKTQCIHALFCIRMPCKACQH